MSATIENDKLILKNPITNEEIGKLDICNKSSFSIIEENACTYDDWSSLKLKERCQVINKFRKIILGNKNEIQQILIKETGKKEFDAFTELFTTLEHIKEITKIAKIRLKNNNKRSV